MPREHIYEPLRSDFHIRLLEIIEELGEPRLKLVQMQLGGPKAALPKSYECISYVWAGPYSAHKVSYKQKRLAEALTLSARLACTYGSNENGWRLQLAGGQGYSISITKSLAEALPFLCSEARTKYIWIDQLCINQHDLDERSSQVSRMGQIYRNATRTIVWLGGKPPGLDYILRPSTEVHTVTAGFLRSFRKWMYGVENYSFVSVFDRSWFTRGWVVQEYALAREVDFLFGDKAVASSDLTRLARTLVTPPTGREVSVKPVLKGLSLSRSCWRGIQDCIFVDDLRNSLTEEIDNTERSIVLQEQLRMLWVCTESFETTKAKDRILAFLGLLPEIAYRPNYHLGFEEMTIDLAICILMQSQRLDILAYARPKHTAVPSWVPTWESITQKLPRWSNNRTGFTQLERYCAPFGSASLQWQAWPLKHRDRSETVGFRILGGNRLLVAGIALGEVHSVEIVNAENLLRGSLVQGVLYGDTDFGHPQFDHLKVLWDCMQVPYGPTWEEARRGELKDQHRDIKYRLDMLEDGQRRIIKVGKHREGISSTWFGEDCIAVVLYNCFVPLILAPSTRGSACYEVVCSAYVRGVMHGGAFMGNTEPLQEFILV